MKIICTICSKHKREDVELLPARVRYTSPHIQFTEEKSKEFGLPFFILSGKYGIISADREIPNYDYYLEMSKAEELSKAIGEQLRIEKITEIDFYTEQKDSWVPYETAMKKGCEIAGVHLTVYPISDMVKSV